MATHSGAMVKLHIKKLIFVSRTVDMPCSKRLWSNIFRVRVFATMVATDALVPNRNQVIGSHHVVDKFIISRFCFIAISLFSLIMFHSLIIHRPIYTDQTVINMSRLLNVALLCISHIVICIT